MAMMFEERMKGKEGGYRRISSEMKGGQKERQENEFEIRKEEKRLKQRWAL